MKRALTAFALVALLGASVAPADLCTIEATPAATLLLPYFEVDIANTNGIDTFFSINNAREYSVLSHVIVWTDMSVEALDFNVYLTGYDVQTIGLGLIIRNGLLPRTAATNTVSNRGAYSDAHPSYASCAGILPYTNPALNAAFLQHLQSILTGGPSSIYGGRCGGYPYGDGIARGYVTVDTVSACTLLTPCDPGYFVPGPGGLVGSWDNALWGEWYMIDYANNFAQGDTLVHIEALEDFDIDLAAQTDMEAARAAYQRILGGNGIGPALTSTFWGRCATQFDLNVVLDFREPLATTFATQFYQNAAFSGGTDFLVWRDSLFNVLFGDEDGFSCAAGPGWFPLNERQTVFFDEQENPEAVCTISPCPQEDILFPLEAQRVSVADIGVTPQSGWAYLNLNQLWNYVQAGNLPTAAQAWVSSVHSAEGRFSAGLNAIQLDSRCDLQSIIIGPSGPDYPYAEDLFDPFYTLFTFGEGAGTPRNVLNP